jgi:hypothetical protein
VVARPALKPRNEGLAVVEAAAAAAAAARETLCPSVANGHGSPNPTAYSSGDDDDD